MSVIMTISMISQFFAYTQLMGKDVFYLGELQSAWGITLKQEKSLLSRLVKRKTIIRLKRGVYLVPKKIPPGGMWQPDSLLLICYFMEISKSNYYISGLYAFNYYGLSEQIPNMITIYNDKLSLQKKLGTLSIQLIKVPKSRLKDNVVIPVADQREVKIASLSRTILDAIMDWQRFGTIPSAYEWIRNFSKDRKIIRDLVNTTLRYGNVSSRRRIGYVLSKLARFPDLTKSLLKSIPVTQNWVLLDPLQGNKGKTDKNWRIIDNVK